MKTRLLMFFVIFIGMMANGVPVSAQGQDNYRTYPLADNDWKKDRTEPASWEIKDGWITYSTKTEPNNNWYSWHGKKNVIQDMFPSRDWFVETNFILSSDLIERKGVRSSIWLNVCDSKNQNVDWAILQFFIDESGQKAWQYFDSVTGEWCGIDNNVPVSPGTYTLKIAYKNGLIIHSINGVDVKSYKLEGNELSYVKEVILNSYSYGESYASTWKVPTVKSEGKGVIAKDVDELVKAVSDQQVSYIQLGAHGYELNSCLTINRDLTLSGIGEESVVKAAANFSGSGSGNNYVINVMKGNVSLEKLKIIGNQKSGFGGINVWGATVALNNIVVEKNSYIALEVSKNAYVTAKGLTLNDNLYGVNIGMGENPSNGKISFTLLEDSKNKLSTAANDMIYVEDKDLPYLKDGSIAVNLPIGWKKFMLGNWSIWKQSNVPDVLNGKITIVPDAADYKKNGETLQEAITYAALLTPKPEIVLGAGVFQGNFVMMEGVNVTGTFANGDSTVLDGNNSGRVVSQKNDDAKYTGDWKAEYAFKQETIWKNLIIRHGKITNDTKNKYGAAAGVYLSKNGVLSNCVVRDNSTEGNDIKAAGVALVCGGRLESCVVESNKACDSYAGVMILGDGTVKSCVIRNNEVTSDEHTAGIGTRYAAPPADEVHEVLIEDCDIYQNKTNGGGSTGLNINKIKATVRVKNTRIHDNDDTSGTKSGVSTGYAEAETENIYLMNCLVYNNGKASSANDPSQNGIVANSGTTILNCTVWDNAGEHSGIYAIESGNPVIKTTNTIAQDYYGGSDKDVLNASHHQITHSLIPTVREGITPTNSIIGPVTTKLFVDSLKGNYIPAIGAPYINKGDNGLWKTSDKDLAGNSRVQGNLVDMGAFESGIITESNPLTLSASKNLSSLVYGDTVVLKFNYPSVQLPSNANVSFNTSTEDTLLVVSNYVNEPFDLEFTHVDVSDGSSKKSLLKSVSISKRHLQVTGLKADDKKYDGNAGVEIKTNKDTTKLTGAINEEITLQNMTFTGTTIDATAGIGKPVTVVASFTDGNGKVKNYLIDPITDVKVSIEKKELTVEMDKEYEMEYGNALPSFDIKAPSGFIEGESIADLGGTLNFDCKATSSSLAGDYIVTPYGYSSSNYNLKYTSSKLKVKPVKPVISIVSTVVNPAKTKVAVTAKVINQGGTVMTELKGKIVAEEIQMINDEFDGNLIVNEEGLFTTELDVTADNEYTIKAFAGKEKLIGDVATASVDTKLNPQTLAITALPDKFVYGAEPQPIVALSNVKDAVVSYESNEPGIVSVSDAGKMTFHKAGVVVITIKAAKEGYMDAVVKQSVTVIPKTITVNVGTITKPYDGTTAIGMLNLSLNGLLDIDKEKVTLNEVKAKFAAKDAGDAIGVDIPVLSLAGEACANYLLIQPSGVMGKIEKAQTPTVQMGEVSRKYNEEMLDYSFTLNSLVEGESVNTVGLFSGSFVMTENEGVYELDAQGVVFKNYKSFSKNVVASGSVVIKKGVPQVITYNTTQGVRGKVVDDGGWGLDKNEFGSTSTSTSNENSYKIETVGNKSLAVVVYDGNKTATGNVTSNGKLADDVVWNIKDPSSSSYLRSFVQTRVEADLNLEYGTEAVVSCEKASNLFTPNTDMLQLIPITGGVLVKAIGYGNGEAAIFANVNDATAYLKVTVERKEVTVSSSDFEKTYDGTTAASGVLKLSGTVNNDAVALDMSKVAFNFADKNVGDNKLIVASRSLTLQKDDAGLYNNYTLQPTTLTGRIIPAELTISGKISKYYDGTAKLSLGNTAISGLVAGDNVTVTMDLNNADVGGDIKGENLEISDNENYKLSVSAPTVTIVKSTMLVKLPEKATGKADLVQNTSFTLQETGMTGIKLNSYNPSYSEAGNVISVSGGNTDNYSVIYAVSTATKGNTPNPDPDIYVTGVSLDKSALSIARGESEKLTATITPSNATNQDVTWKSSNKSIVAVDSDGKVTAVKVGEATITVTTDDGGYTATCKVMVGHPVGLDEDIANTNVYVQSGAICIEPVSPMHALVVNVAGYVLFNERIGSVVRVPVEKGIYIVKFGSGDKIAIRKISVR